MKGAIFFSSKYGSTAQYAQWIGENARLPLYNMKTSKVDPSQFDFLILGSPIIYYGVWHNKWVKKNMDKIKNIPVLYFTVSGAPAGAKLDGWINKSLPAPFIKRMRHVALQGRQIPNDLTWFDRMNLRIAAFFNKDPKARKDELQGFDYMDKSTIKPILEFIEEMQREKKKIPA